MPDGQSFAGGWLNGAPHGEGIQTVVVEGGTTEEQLFTYDQGQIVSKEPVNREKCIKLLNQLEEIVTCTERTAAKARFVEKKVHTCYLFVCMYF
jgi:hypothetical protein